MATTIRSISGVPTDALLDQLATFSISEKDTFYLVELARMVKGKATWGPTPEAWKVEIVEIDRDRWHIYGSKKHDV